jgi:hypothetical protein
MTAKDLVELSGITEDENFSEFDYAVPINENGTYPYNGRAITVYWKGDKGVEIIPHSSLAAMAIKRQQGELEEMKTKEIKKKEYLISQLKDACVSCYDLQRMEKP